MLECLNSAGNSSIPERKSFLGYSSWHCQMGGKDSCFGLVILSLPVSPAFPAFPRELCPFQLCHSPSDSPTHSKLHSVCTKERLKANGGFILIHFMSLCCLATDSKALGTNHSHPLDHHFLNFHPL